MSWANLHNPICPEPVRTPEQFFGRGKEIRRALSSLQKGQSVSVVGRAKIGKTSFLFHIADRQVRARRGLAQDQVFVYIDCHSLIDCNEGQICSFFLQEIVHQSKGIELMERTTQAKKEEAVQLIEAQVPFLGLRSLFEAIRDNGIELVVVMDNYESLAENFSVKDSFFSGLRALSRYMTYLLASQSPLIELERITVGSPFFNIFETIELRRLAATESRELVAKRLEQAGADFPQYATDCILELGENEPYGLQRAGSIALAVWRSNGRSLQAKDCDEIRRKFAENDHTKQA